MSRIINICVVLTMIAAHSWAEPNAGDVANAFIVHIPIPLAARGKPFPIIAGTKGDAGTLKDITVSIKSSGAAKGSKLKMRTMGDGRYQAIIPAKTTAAATELVYRIEATTALGINTTTPWYPVKLETLEDKVKDTVEKKAPDKKPGKIRKFVKAHPIATGVGAVVVVGGGIAASSGGGSSSSGDSGSISSPSGNDSSATSGQTTVNVTGNWSYTNPMPTETIHGSMQLAQSGTSVSGSFSEEGDGGSVSGSVSGSSISLTLHFSDGSVDRLSGTVSGNSMSGSWLETDTGDRGSFTASR